MAIAKRARRLCSQRITPVTQSNAGSKPGKTGIYVDEKNQADLDRVR